MKGLTSVAAALVGGVLGALLIFIAGVLVSTVLFPSLQYDVGIDGAVLFLFGAVPAGAIAGACLGYRLANKDRGP